MEPTPPNAALFTTPAEKKKQEQQSKKFNKLMYDYRRLFFSHSICTNAARKKILYDRLNVMADDIEKLKSEMPEHLFEQLKESPAQNTEEDEK